MPTEIQLLNEMRKTVRAVLPERAFLRYDRGDALFVSNAPAFTPEIPAIPGFTFEAKNRLIFIAPDESWIERLESSTSAAPDALCASLMRFRGHRPDSENLRLFIRGLKLLDLTGSPAENETYDRALRQRAAVALRGGCGGGLYAAALINACIHPPKGEKQP